MKNLLFLTILIVTLYANDAAYYMTGNQLIPINDKTIMLKKEILEIKKVDEENLEVKVQYHLFNPNEAKTILVGFEASSPEGGVDGTPKKGKHPYINNFSVIMNNQQLPFKTAIVKDKEYYKSGEIKSEKLSNVLKDITIEAPDFYYVYYFKAPFKKGENTIIHTYNYALSLTVINEFSFDYKLTTAKRWANKQIDDFTLKIDMGEFKNFVIKKTFFENNSEWQVNGQMRDIQKFMYEKANYTEFFVQRSPIIFQKKDFKLNGDLFIISIPKQDYDVDFFDYKKDKLPYDIFLANQYITTKDNLSYKILRNLPYARRGYDFKNSTIKKYYNSMLWYKSNPNYKASLNSLTKTEKEWLKKLK